MSEDLPQIRRPWLLGAAVAVGLLAAGIYMALTLPRIPRATRNQFAGMAGAMPTSQPTTAPADETMPYEGPPGTLVSLSMKDAPPASVAAELAKQSGIEIAPYPANLWNRPKIKPINISVAQEPFWPALMQLCAAANVYPYPSSEAGRRILLASGSAERVKCPSVCNGPFLVVLNNIQRTAVVEPSGTSAVQHEVAIQLTLFVEPKVTAISLPSVATIEEAIDDRGMELDAVREEGQRNSGSWASPLRARLRSPAKPGNRLAKLAGYATLRVRPATEALEVNNVTTAREVSKKVGAVEIKFKALTKTPRGYSATFELVSAPDATEARRLAARPGLARLTDGQGRAYTPVIGTPSNTGFTIDFVRSRSNLQEPAKLTFTITALPQDVRVPFEFKDVPLP